MVNGRYGNPVSLRCQIPFFRRRKTGTLLSSRQMCGVHSTGLTQYISQDYWNTHSKKKNIIRTTKIHFYSTVSYPYYFIEWTLFTKPSYVISDKYGKTNFTCLQMNWIESWVWGMKNGQIQFGFKANNKFHWSAFRRDMKNYKSEKFGSLFDFGWNKIEKIRKDAMRTDFWVELGWPWDCLIKLFNYKFHSCDTLRQEFVTFEGEKNGCRYMTERSCWRRIPPSKRAETSLYRCQELTFFF